MNLQGNLTNLGTFTQRSGTVTLDGTSQTLTGPTTFYNLSKTVTSAATLTLEDTGVFTVSNALSLTGATGQLLTLTSDDVANTVDLDLVSGGTQSLNYLSIVRIDSATGIQMNPTNSTNGGGNINWNFGVGEVQGLVGHWNFDDNVTDQSGLGNNGTLNGTSGTNTTGPAYNVSIPSTAFTNTRSLDFDGTDDYVDVGNDLWDTATQGTIAFWVYRTGGTTVIGSASDSNSNELFDIYFSTDDTLRVENFLPADRIRTTAAMPKNSWEHYAVTSDGLQWRIYHNGAEEAVTVVNGSNSGLWFNAADYGTNSYGIGALIRAGTPQYHVSGLIDDVRIYNVALTAQEIASLAAGTAKRNFVWDGSASAAWNTAANWDLGLVPTTDATVSIPDTVNDPVLAGATTVNDLTIQTGALLKTNGQNLTVSSTFSNSGTLQVIGSEATVSLTQDIDSGTWEYIGDGTGAATTHTIKDFGAGVDYYHLTINDASASNSDTFQLGAALDVNGNLTLTAGTLDVNATGNYSINLAGNWSNASSGSGIFESRTGIVYFDSAGTQTIDAGGAGNSNKDFYDVYVTNAGITRLLNGMETDRDFRLEGGTFEVNNFELRNQAALAGTVTTANGTEVDLTGSSSLWRVAVYDGTTATISGLIDLNDGIVRSGGNITLAATGVVDQTGGKIGSGDVFRIDGDFNGDGGTFQHYEDSGDAFAPQVYITNATAYFYNYEVRDNTTNPATINASSQPIVVT